MHCKQLATLLLCLFTSGYVRVAASEGELYFKLPSAVANASDASPRLKLHGRDARWQLQLSQSLASSADSDSNSPVTSRDVTRQVAFRVEPAEVAQVDANGFVTPLASGSATISATLDGHPAVSIGVEVSGMETTQPVHFANQIVPIFTKFGCNGGGCHGKAAGQAGFKLSLLGFEPREDYAHLVTESRGRRVFPAVPAQSLLLQKGTNQTPHGGGSRLEVDSHEYRLLERWIASGLAYGDPAQAHVTSIEVVPQQARLERGASQQLSVIAIYSDGSIEDITRTAQYESNNTDLADVSVRGLVSLTDRPGDVAIMTRYQGQVAVFRATVPLGISIEAWPKSRNVVDELVFSKLNALGIPPSPVCDDATFIRRVTLDLCGRLPTISESEAFLQATSEDKYEAAVDRLLSSIDHAEFFAKKWSTILRNRRDSVGHQAGTFAFYDWLRDGFYENKPYDQMVGELLTASGSVDSNPPVTWLREVASTESRVEDAAQLFLGQRIQCARCHHHPFEKWSQADYFHMAAFFSKVTRREGETPEQPRFVSRSGAASAQHPKTGEALAPAGLGAEPVTLAATADPREELARWMTDENNPFFARALVNRYWKHFFAVGLVEPEDDMRVTNPASNPELLDGLAEYFSDSGYNLRSLLRLICTSTTYRLSSDANDYNLNNQSYARYYPKRLQAEVLLDAVDQVLLTHTTFEGVPPQTRAVSLPDNRFSSYFLDVFGKPDSTSACECERSQEATLAQSLHLLNSKEMQAKLASDDGLAASLAASSDPLEHKIEQLYLAALSRSATDSEIQAASAYILAKPDAPRPAYEDLVWAVLNSKEFLFNH
jgi:hypothetical protein